MSEEKIVKEYNDIINALYMVGQIKDVDGKVTDILKLFLDLYNKEKEKNKELLEKLEMRNILIMRKDHNTKEIFGELFIKKDEIEKKYIHKDKIKNKMEILKNELLSEGNYIEFLNKKSVYYALKELLESEV